MAVIWLIDKSALVHLPGSPDAIHWAGRIERGLVRITTVTRLEVGYSARTGSDLRTGLRQPPLSAMPVEYLTPAIEDRAAEVLTMLAGLTVLHLDKNFEVIADITRQPVERLRAN